MITGAIEVPGYKELRLVMELKWSDNRIDLFEDIILTVPMEPFIEGNAVLHRREYRESWSPVDACKFFDLMGKMQREGKLSDIFFDEDREEIKA